MGFLSWLFGAKQLSQEEIGEYLAKTSKHDLAGVVSCVALEQHLSAKGLKQAAEGKKLLKRHKAVFQGCSTGADIGSRVIAVIDKWPALSPEEFAFASDLVAAHKRLKQNA
jgi:hypothetical protein